MKKFLTLALVLPFLFLNCSKELVTNPSLNNNENGKVLLKIDKTNAPSGVVFVDAVLTRDKFDDRKAEVNLTSGSSTDISLDSIPAGNWHLKVEAADKDRVVIYSGESGVTILAGITLQVSLTLTPTGNGTGGILIHVNWGVSQSWKDYENNPLITPDIVPDHPLAVSLPKIIFEDNAYKMWFTSVYNSAVANVWYAISKDGINWQLGSNSPVLNYGVPGSWDSHSVQAGAVIKDGDEYKMYYLGFSDEYGAWDIGLATSSDGINWIKNPNPVVYADSNEFQIAPSDVIKINDEFFLYYTVRNYSYYEIRLAVSHDSFNFTKFNGNPILTTDKYWEDNGIYNPSIIYDDNKYKMVYMNSSATGFGLAYSKDGKSWIKDSGNPFFNLNQTNNNWCVKIAYPFWRKINGIYKVYYVGNTGSYSKKIGLLQK